VKRPSIQHAETDGLGDVRRANIRLGGQVGAGPRQRQDPMQSAAAEAEAQGGGGGQRP